MVACGSFILVPVSGSEPTISAHSHLLKTLDSNHLTTLPPAPHSAPKPVRGYFFEILAFCPARLRQARRWASRLSTETSQRTGCFATSHSGRLYASPTAQKPLVAKFKRGQLDLFQLYPRRDPPLARQESESRRSRERRLRRFAGEGDGGKAL